MNTRDLCYNHDIDDLRTVKLQNAHDNNQSFLIKGIAHEYHIEHPMLFYKVNTIGQLNYVAKQCVLHHHVVNFLFVADNFRLKKITLPVTGS